MRIYFNKDLLKKMTQSIKKSNMRKILNGLYLVSVLNHLVGAHDEAEIVPLKEIAHNFAAENVAHAAIIRSPARHALRKMSNNQCYLRPTRGTQCKQKSPRKLIYRARVLPRRGRTTGDRTEGHCQGRLLVGLWL
jgi:hypothetical protein